MSSKRTRRIQTVISPEHHDLLLELTRTHGKMNHIIEQGIEQVYQSKTGIHTCDASGVWTRACADVPYSSIFVL